MQQSNYSYTLKNLCNGFPVLFVETSDVDRHYAPFGVAVYSHERFNDLMGMYD